MDLVALDLAPSLNSAPDEAGALADEVGALVAEDDALLAAIADERRARERLSLGLPTGTSAREYHILADACRETLRREVPPGTRWRPRPS